MKLAIVLSLLFWVVKPPDWQLDFEKAKQKAQLEHKYILLNFSGSDWCGPCIKLKKDIFNTDIFNDFASDKLVLVNADFPRLKKNALSAEQQKKNELLADAYNPKGIFPFTILLTSDGKVIQSWEGTNNFTPQTFITRLQQLTDARK